MTFSSHPTTRNHRSADLRSQNGQVAVLALLCMITLCGFVALVANMGRLVVEKIRLQNAADLAAFSGASFQATALNRIARLNKEQSAYINGLSRTMEFDNEEDAQAWKDAIEEETWSSTRTMKNWIRSYGTLARKAAWAVTSHNFPGATISQVGVQIKKGEAGDEDDIVGVDYEDVCDYDLAYGGQDKFTFKWDCYTDRHGHRRCADRLKYKPSRLYLKKTSTAAFWARLEKSIKPPDLPRVFFLGTPGGEIVLAADSMATPYGGHVGTAPNSAGFTFSTNPSPTYEVKFSAINHRQLDIQTVPSPSNIESYRVWKREAEGPPEVIAELFEPVANRFNYAH